RFVQGSSRKEILSTLSKAYFSAFKELPRMWRKRKEIEKLKKVPNKKIREWFKIFGMGVKEIALKE
ncbi:MAG: hypothetical protein JSU92_03240, partial [Deltaproteobacteria bacterium]